MNTARSPYQQALQNARQAYRQGDQRTVRYWAQQAAHLDPNQEEPWLWLAAVASPRASIDYIQRALQINPDSQRARKAMHWAVKQLRARQITHNEQLAQTRPLRVSPAIPATATRPIPRKKPARRAAWPWLSGILIILVVVASWLAFPWLVAFSAWAFPTPAANVAAVDVAKATYTPSPTYTPTAPFTPPLSPPPPPPPNSLRPSLKPAAEPGEHIPKFLPKSY